MPNINNRKRFFEARNPLLVLLLAIAVFALADNFVFRTAVYAHLPMITTSGRLAHFILDEESRPPSGKEEVMATGSSKMQFGLWDKVAENAADPGGRFRIINGATHGASEKWTYYILKRLDPGHRRYRAIVISDSEYKVYPYYDDQENDFAAAQALAPFITVRDWPDFISSFTNPAVRENVRYQGIFSSHGVGMDLLLSSGRIAERILHGGVTKLLTDEGPPESVVALSTSVPGTAPRGSLVRVVSYPAHFDVFQRENADADFRYPSTADAIGFTRRQAQFHQKWLTKIIEMYEDSPTKLIFVQMPRWPVRLPRTAPIASAPDIRDLLPRRKNVVFLDDSEFTFLEQPKYFWDLHHLNRVGRRLFSERLGIRIREILENSTDHAPESSVRVETRF